MTRRAGLNVCTKTESFWCAFLKSKQTTYNTTTLVGHVMEKFISTYIQKYYPQMLLRRETSKHFCTVFFYKALYYFFSCKNPNLLLSCFNFIEGLIVLLHVVREEGY